MDAAGEKVAAVVQIPKTGNIAKFYARIGTVTTAQALKGSVQSLDATMNADGTPIQSGTHASPASNTWATFTFGSVYAATKGDWKAFVVEWNATAGNLNILADSFPRHQNVYPELFTTAWAKQGRSPIVILEYDDGSIEFVLAAIPGVTTSTDFAQNSSPDENALRFQSSVPMTVAGITFAGRLSGPCDLVLYDGTTSLASVSLDNDGNSGAGDAVFSGMFASPQALLANTVYRAAVRPTSNTNVRLFYFDANANGWLDQYDGGKEFYWSQRTNDGAWSDTTTRRPQIGLVLSGLSDGAGGGTNIFMGQPNVVLRM